MRSILLAMLFCATSVCAQEFNPDQTVIPLHEFRFYGPAAVIKYGTGFCLDPECRFIGTNYHVAKLMNPPFKVRGESVVQRQFASGPDDDGAATHHIAGPLGILTPLKYTYERDLGVFELRHPLNHRGHYHGPEFDLNELVIGQKVDIYAYPKKAINPVRQLTAFHGTYKGVTQDHLLAFDYDTSTDSVRPGASGGLIVSNGKVVGILNAVAMHEDGVALAVPVQALADFLAKSQPYLHSTLFPQDGKPFVSPVSQDLYPAYVPEHVSGHREPEPPAVVALRARAQELSDSMRNFIAVQSFAWGRDNNAPVALAQYEVRIWDGWQRFREYPDGKKELDNVPFPPMNDAMRPGGEWSELPKLVSTELHLHIREADPATVNGRHYRVFQYMAGVEDRVCQWGDVYDFLVASHTRMTWVACHGEVWTDDDLNIIRMSENDDLPGRWKNYKGVVTYDWLRSKIIPMTINTQVEYDGKVHWCRGVFTNYQEFATTVKIGK